MKSANPWFLDDLSSAMIAYEDENIIPVADESSIRSEIRAIIVPQIHNKPTKYQEKLKDTLGYALHFGVPFDRQFSDPIELRIIPPTPIRLFFEWVWDELYPGESYNKIDYKDYKVIPIIEEPIMLSIVRN